MFAGRNLSDVGEECGVSASAVSQWETGARDPRPPMIPKYAKAIGITMGTPAFMLQDEIRKHNIAVFSSNYTLYGDMSDRVMKTFMTLEVLDVSD